MGLMNKVNQIDEHFLDLSGDNKVSLFLFTITQDLVTIETTSSYKS